MLFMFLPATVIHSIHATANQQGTVWLTNSEGPSKMQIFFFFCWILEYWLWCFSFGVIYSFQPQERLSAAIRLRLNRACCSYLSF